MAMLGKRFQRTISMSQIGPGSNLHSDKGQAAHSSSSNPPPSSADPAAKLPLIRQDAPQMANEQLLLQVSAHPWEALKARGKPEEYQHHHLQSHHHRQQSTAPSPWEALKGIACAPQQGDRPAPRQQEQLSSSPNQWDLLKSAEAKMMAMMPQSGISVSGSSPNDHLGNWPQFSNPSSSPLSLPRSHFLDACFLCKRHLWQERDIFIYRGDKAFCSEECRHRQMLTDEALSMRASRK